MTKDEALKMAIELIERFLEHDGISSSDYIDVLEACEEALEQPAQDFFERGKEIAKWADKQNEQPAQEPVSKTAERDYNFMRDLAIGTEDILNEMLSAKPVAWMAMGLHTSWLAFQKEAVKDAKEIIPLYTHPAPSWQGLSDDEILEIDKSIDPKIIIGKGKTLFARAIEQALKEKNHE